MLIRITKGFIFANRSGKKVKLTADDGPIDWLPEEAALSLVKRCVAEIVEPEKKNAKPAGGAPAKPAAKKKAKGSKPVGELDTLRARAAELNIDISALGDDPDAIRQAIASAEGE